MKGVKEFLPLLLLAVATRAIPLPEPRSIAVVSAQDSAVEWDGRTHEGALDKREVRGDLDTAEAETESVTTEMTESEMEPAENDEAAESETEKDQEQPVEETEEEATTTEVAEDAADGTATVEEEEPKEEEEKMEDVEEEEEKMVIEPEDSPVEEEETKVEEDEAKVQEEEAKAQEEQAVTEDTMMAKKPEEKKIVDEEKVDGRIGEVGKQDGELPTLGSGGGDGAGSLVPPEEGRPIFTFGPFNVHGPSFPWPIPPLPLDLPIDGFPDHPVQQVGNEVNPQGKVVFPIYLIRFDHRYLQESPY